MAWDEASIWGRSALQAETNKSPGMSDGDQVPQSSRNKMCHQWWPGGPAGDIYTLKELQNLFVKPGCVSQNKT